MQEHAEIETAYFVGYSREISLPIPVEIRGDQRIEPNGWKLDWVLKCAVTIPQ